MAATVVAWLALALATPAAAQLAAVVKLWIDVRNAATGLRQAVRLQGTTWFEIMLAFTLRLDFS